MASTSKTEKLGLNQWEKTDPVDFRDFNADNLKLDTVLASALKLEPLWELSYANSKSNVITLDTREFDFGKYLFLIVTSECSNETDVFLNDETEFTGYLENKTALIIFPLRDAGRLFSVMNLRDDRYFYIKSTRTYAEVSKIRIAPRTGDFPAGLNIRIWGIK